MIEQLGELYRDVILEHFQRPSRKGELPDAPIRVEGANPLCGDELVYQLRINGSRIERIRFSGKGCAISQAAASMLADQLEGKTTDQAMKLIAGLKALMQDGSLDDGIDFGDLEALAGVRKFPVRVKCAALSWNVVEQGLTSGDRHFGAKMPVPGRSKEV